MAPAFLLTSLPVAFLVILVTKLVYNDWIRNSKHYPPGPKPKFLIGNALDFPKTNSSRVFIEWGKKYNSGLLWAGAFGMDFVVINDVKIAEDLLERRAKLYNDRPENPIVKFLEWGSNVALLHYGNEWRRHRKVCQQRFHADAVKRYHPIQFGQVERFLKNVLREPESVFDQFQLLSIAIPMLMMYGYAPETNKDPIIEAANESTRLAGILFDFGGTFISMLPFLYYVPSWMPGATGKRMIEEVRQLTRDARRIPMEHVTAALKTGTASSSLVTDFLEKKATSGVGPDEEEIINNIAWTVYGAASDTTISATGSFLFLMVTHPEMQRTAQEEIDRIIGSNRLPDFNDRPSLPYVEAVYHELMRHSPPLPLGVPHALTEDDVYEGYFIPKGAAIVTNIWAMTHDENVYPDPYSFKPERFLDANGKMKKDSRILAYGFGRRICVGKYVASDFLWLVIVSWLACFNIDKAKDETGNEIEIDDTYHDLGLIRHKIPFKCSITPRSLKTRQLIEGCLGSERYQ